MKRRKLRRVAMVTAVAFLSCCGLPGYGLFHLSLHNSPEGIHSHYAHELDEYGRRLVAGDVRFVEGSGYALPQFLIDKDAKWVHRNGSCYAVVFSSLLDNPTLMLWFSPAGSIPCRRN